jgi:hypothetical protein
MIRRDLLALCTASMLWACGGGSSGNDGAGSGGSGGGIFQPRCVDACTLVTDAELVTLLEGSDNQTLESGACQTQQDSIGSTCSWEPVSASGTPFLRLSALSENGKSFDTVRNTQMQINGFADVSGIGDRAFVVGGLGENESEIIFRIDDLTLSLLFRSTASDRDQRLRTEASAIVDRARAK